MNTARLLGLAIVIAGSAAAAHAQDTLTRAQVRAETHAAQLAGEIPHGDLDFSSLHPGGDVHPTESGASTLTRAQVAEQLAQARAAGALPAIGDSGRTLAEVEPARYPQADQAPGLTRAEVRRELAMAVRDGDIPQGDVGRTAAQENPARYAAVRARDGESRLAMN